MDKDRFDAFTRTLSSRRTALGGLLGGGLAALLGLALPEEVGAHNFLARCRKIKDGPRRRACLRRARAHNRSHRPPPCVAQSPTVTCAGRCGTWLNNCNQATPCFLCSAGKGCISNGSCAQACTSTCPAGCACSNASVEGPRHCIVFVSSCAQAPQVCASTTQCPVGQHCQTTTCGPGGTPENRCVPLCAS